MMRSAPALAGGAARKPPGVIQTRWWWPAGCRGLTRHGTVRVGQEGESREGAGRARAAGVGQDTGVGECVSWRRRYVSRRKGFESGRSHWQTSVIYAGGLPVRPPEFDSIALDLKTRYRNFLLEDAEGDKVPDLLTAEEQVSRFIHEVGLSLLQLFVNVRSEQAKEDRGPCTCGGPATIHRTTKWRRETPFGPVVVRDPYVYCRACRGSKRPLHEALGTDRETWSLMVQEAAVDLVADEPAGKAVAKLARHHPGIEMERTTALRMLHKHGEHAREFIEHKLGAARKLAELPAQHRDTVAGELEVEWDAGMIPVATLEPVEVPEGEAPKLTPVRGLPVRRRDCRWEEAKLGLVQKPGEINRLYSVRPTGELDASFDDLLALACLKGWTEQTQVRGLADGALHIRPRMEEVFNAGCFQFILDRPHCKEHLSSAGEQLRAEGALGDGVTVQQWASDALVRLETGDVAGVVAELTRGWEASAPDPESRNDTLRLEAAYFEHNSDAVQYAEYRASGWSTASSEVESAHRHVVQARLKISGAWWHPDNVGNILALRMLKANGWWREYWAERRRAWRIRAQTFAEPRRRAA